MIKKCIKVEALYSKRTIPSGPLRLSIYTIIGNVKRERREREQTNKQNEIGSCRNVRKATKKNTH